MAISNKKIKKLNLELIKKIQVQHGPYDKLLKYIAIDNALRFEVRTEGKANIYYKKCVALTLGARSCSVEDKYFINGIPDEFDKKLKVAIENPRLYFQTIKKEIDNWQSNENINKQKYSAIQKIATFNQLNTDRYIIVEMECELNQKGTNDKSKKNGYDLVAINQKAKSVVLFDVIYGLEELKDIKTHIETFELNFRKGEDILIFTNQLDSDIRNIIADKNTLGLLNFQLAEDFVLTSIHIDYKFIYVFDNTVDHQLQISKYNSIIESYNIPSYYQTIFVDADEIPKLS